MYVSVKRERLFSTIDAERPEERRARGILRGQINTDYVE